MTFKPVVLSPTQREFVNAYVDYACRLGMRRYVVTRAARGFCSHIGLAEDWLRLSLEQQLALPNTSRQIMRWLFVSCRIAAPVEYLVAAHIYPGQAAAAYYPQAHARFVAAGAAIGYPRDRLRRQWGGACADRRAQRPCPRTK